MPTFFLIDFEDEMPRWCELAALDGCSFWVDLKGRRIPCETAKPLAHVEGDNIADAMTKVSPEVAKLEQDMAFRFLLDPWSDQGWVSPDGRFYGCRFFVHDEIAYALLRSPPAALEDTGWVRVHADSFRQAEATRQGMSSRQEKTILALGFVETSSGWRRSPSFSIDRNQAPPPYAVKPPARIAIERHSVSSTRAEKAPAVTLSSVLTRLSAHPEYGRAFESGNREEIPDVGAGIWLWMVRFDEFDLGSDVSPDEVMSDEGIHLRATSFDTIEVAPWPFPGIEVSPEAKDILQRAIERCAIRRPASLP